jgi:hypothetical protein
MPSNIVALSTTDAKAPKERLDTLAATIEAAEEKAAAARHHVLAAIYIYVAFMPLHNSLVLMCAIRFNFMSRNRSKFEYGLNSKWFANSKVFFYIQNWP